MTNSFGVLAVESNLNVVIKSTKSIEPKSTPTAVDLSEVYGQDQAKRALKIAAARGHNFLLPGPPGAGKTLSSMASIGLVPPPSLDEMIEITKVYCLAGLADGRLMCQRPFRSPHHTASGVALIGDGYDPPAWRDQPQPSRRPLPG